MPQCVKRGIKCTERNGLYEETLHGENPGRLTAGQREWNHSVEPLGGITSVWTPRTGHPELRSRRRATTTHKYRAETRGESNIACGGKTHSEVTQSDTSSHDSKTTKTKNNLKVALPGIPLVDSLITNNKVPGEASALKHVWGC